MDKSLEVLLGEGVSLLGQLGTADLKKYKNYCERYAVLQTVTSAVGGRVGFCEIDEVTLISDFVNNISPSSVWALSSKLRRASSERDLKLIHRKLAFIIGNLIPKISKKNLLDQWKKALPARHSTETDSSLLQVIESAEQLNSGIQVLISGMGSLPYSFWNPEEYILSQEEILIETAQLRSLAHINSNSSVVVEGVALCNPAVVSEIEAISGVLSIIKKSALPQFTLAEDPNILFARIAAGLVASGGPDRIKSYYMQAYSAYAINPRLHVGSNSREQSIPQALVATEWRKGMWETSLASQVSTIVVALQKETFAIPMDVWTPTAVEEKGYEKEAIDSLDTLTRLTSPWAKDLHGILIEIREDLHSALLRRPASCVEGKDVAGQWQAARNVIEVLLGVTSLIISTACNAFHSRVDRFCYSETNLLPFLLCISDIFTFLTLHFNLPVVNLLQLHQQEDQKDKVPKIDCESLLGMSAGGGFTKNIECGVMLTKLAVQVGIGIDKVRSDIVKICNIELYGYCNPPKQKEELAWGNDPTYKMCSLMTNLVHPVVKVSQRIVPEVGNSVLTFTITSVLETLVDSVREYILKDNYKCLMPPNTDVSWPVALPPSVAQEHPILTSLWNDVSHLAGYLNLRAPDLNLTSQPFWAQPAVLLQQIKAASQ